MPSKSKDTQDVSLRGKMIRGAVMEFNKNSFIKNHFVGEERNISDIDKHYKYSDAYVVNKYELDNFPMEMIEPKEGNDLVILQLHGGGYVNAFKHQYRNMAKLYSEMGGGAKVLTIDYRVAPEHTFPAAFEDAIAAFDWLIEQGYKEEQIIVAGDSAGGGLAMALTHYLKDQERKLPAALVCMSPWTDLTISGKSYTENVSLDPVFGNSKEDIINKSCYIGGNDAANPYISPMFGDFTGFPPMLIQVGTHEMLFSDSETVAEKAKAVGVDVTFTIYEGMFHVFQMVGLLMPESKAAWQEIGEFIKNTI